MLNNILGQINDFMYTYLLLFLLVGTGLYFTIRSRFAQVRLLKEGFRILTEKADVKDGKRQVSSFQALMISTASRVGTGNIAGIATAVAAGGPGAVFWMWLMAVIGGASAFIESTLAQVYKTKDGKDFRGGPSYYMEKALGKRWMGVLFSVLLIICFAYGFNGLQSYNMSSALEYYIPGYSDSVYPMIVGLVLAVGTGLVIFGGVHRIGFITSVMVPIMAGAYLLIGLFTIVTHLPQLPGVLAMILSEAFDVQAIMGGLAGSAVVIGIKRGLFSNEAGMGSAPNAAASASVSHPAKQGMVQVISVFIDTLLICSATAFMCLSTNIDPVKYAVDGSADAAGYVQASMGDALGSFGPIFLAVAMSLFAFTTLIGNYSYCEGCLEFIIRRVPSRGELLVFRIIATVVVYIGAVASAAFVWDTADMLQGMIVVVNVPTILILGGTAVRCLNDYVKQRKEGKDPQFIAKDIGVKEDTDFWK